MGRRSRVSSLKPTPHSRQAPQARPGRTRSGVTGGRVEPGQARSPRAGTSVEAARAGAAGVAAATAPGRRPDLGAAATPDRVGRELARRAAL